jgi:hypothetical protein
MTLSVTDSRFRGPVMTLADYLDPAKFPLTTRPGLSPQGQLFLDAFEYDRMCRYLKGGDEVSEGQKARRAELEAKMKHHARLAAELAARQKEGRPTRDGRQGTGKDKGRRDG